MPTSPTISTAITKAHSLASGAPKRVYHEPHLVRIFWGVMIALSLGAIATFVLGPSHTEVEAARLEEAPSTAAPVSAVPPSAPVVAPKIVLPEADPALANALNQVPIKAAIAGDDARVLSGASIIRVGEEITRGLLLVKIENNTLFARDEYGAVYTRRF